MILGLVPVLAPNNPVLFDTLLSGTFLVIFSTYTVQPELKFVPSKPLLPLVQVSMGVAGRFAKLQVEAVTALLVRHIVSVAAAALAVTTSPLMSAMLFNVQVAPDATLETVPTEPPFLYTVMVAVAAAPVSADLVQVPLIFTVPILKGAFRSGAAVHMGVVQLDALLNIGQPGWPMIKSS